MFYAHILITLCCCSVCREYNRAEENEIKLKHDTECNLLSWAIILDVIHRIECNTYSTKHYNTTGNSQIFVFFRR